MIGTPVEIDAPAEIGSHFDRLFSAFRDTPSTPSSVRVLLSVAGGPSDGYQLTRNGQTLTVDQSALAIVTRALAEINTLAVAGLKLFAVHSGVVSAPGGAVAFPAASGTGKSTITAACLMAGFDYLSDEALILTDEGRVVPYPKPLSLSAETRRLLGVGNSVWPEAGVEEVAMTPAELGATVGPGGSELRHVVILERGTGPSTLVRQPSAETVTALLRYSFNHFLRPEAAYRLACRVAARSEFWRLELGHPEQAAELLRTRLAS